LISQPDFDVDQIEKLIRGDLSLSYKLLRYLNSPIFLRKTPVQSVRHAITTLGQQPLQKWVSIVAMHGLSGQQPSELMNTCLVRARFSELLGEKLLHPDLWSDCFIVGMFSLLDAMLGQPMEDILRELSLSDDVQHALLQRDSPLLPIVELASAMEYGDWSTINRLASSLGIEEADVYRLHNESIEWAAQMQPTASDTT
jgi:EAL and modified HD-GYP domain-containing signal transduction protein